MSAPRPWKNTGWSVRAKYLWYISTEYDRIPGLISDISVDLT